MNVVHNPFEQASQLLESLRPLSMKYLSSDGASIIDDLQAKLNDDRINVMMFGAYNAGKSTLINALIGRNEARIGDVPTTDKVDRYDWEGHVLLDTPGVNAPVEHEEVTKAQLRRADLVLFVVRGGDQDAQDVYDRLFDLLKSNRPVFVLLNDDSGDPGAAEEQLGLLNMALLIQAEKKGYPSDKVREIPVVLLNAESARRGRVEGKALLREKSGYDKFVGRFNNWLSKFSEAEQRFDLLKDRIERQLLEPLRSALEVSSGSDDPLQTVADEITRLEQEQRIHRTRLRSWLRAELMSARNRIGALLDKGDDGSGFQMLADDLIKKLEAWLQAECGEEIKALERVSVEGPEADETDGGGDGSLLGDVSRKALRSVRKEEIKEILLAGRSAGLPFLKGRWEQTLGKWAGKAAPIVQAFAAIWEVRSAVSKEQEQNRKLLAAAMRRQQAIEEISDGLESALTEASVNSLQMLGQCRVAPLEARREELKQKADMLARDRVLLSQKEDELASLSCVNVSHRLPALLVDS